MTFAEKVRAYLDSHGLFEDCINDILALQKEKTPEMENRWSDKIEDYPASMQAAILVRTDGYAAEWMEKNQPQHFMLPFFKGEIK
jgi:hypothetical protein